MSGDRPSLKTDEGRFEYLVGELKVIKGHTKTTTDTLDRLDKGKVDVAQCRLQEQAVQASLAGIKVCVEQVAASVEQTVNGALEAKVGELVGQEVAERSARAELERLRAQARPLLQRLKDRAAAITAILALCSTIGGGLYMSASWVMGYMAKKLETAAAGQHQLSKDVRDLKDKPYVVNVAVPPVKAALDAGVRRRRPRRRRPLTRRRVVP